MAQAITKQEYENKVLKAQKPVVVEVFSKTCGTCQQMKPIFAEIEQEHGNTYDFYIIDVEQARDLVEELGVRSVPTFLFIKDGKIIAQEHGYIAKEDFVEKITTHLG